MIAKPTDLSLVAEWRHGEDGIVYVAGGQKLGCGHYGLKRLFGLFRSLPPGTQLIIRSPLTVLCGGEAPDENLPWTDQQEEFDAIVAERKLRIRMEYVAPEP